MLARFNTAATEALSELGVATLTDLSDCTTFASAWQRQRKNHLLEYSSPYL